MNENYEKYIRFEKDDVLDCKIYEFDADDIVEQIKFIEINQNEELQKVLHIDEYERLKKFHQYALSENIALDFFNSIQLQGEIKLQHPLNNELMIAKHSVQNGWANYLRFLSNNEVIYLYQFNYTVEGLFFPQRGISIFFPNLLDVKNRTYDLLKKLANNISEYKKYFNKLPNFGGVKLEHPSPYHYYYLKVRALHAVVSNLLDPLYKLNVITSSKGSFLEIENIFPDVVNSHYYLDDFVSYEGKKTPAECFNNSFYISMGLRWKAIRSESDDKEIKENLKKLDSIVLKHSLHIVSSSPIYLEVLKSYQKNDFILWLGITTGKRKWLEEVDAYCALITRLSANHHNLTIVFDGWTGTHLRQKEQPQIHKLFSEDEVIESQIIERLKDTTNVKFLSLIGKTSEEKIAVASKVDFFVANHATGSLWVSRIARRSGVTHISNAARESTKWQHIHWDASLIPEHKVTDIDPDSQQTPFHVSYRIPVDVFLEACLTKISGEKVTKSLENQSGDLDAFFKLTKKIKPEHQGADILREVALSFEQSGDIEIALKVMRKALELRPNGPFIKKKVEEYLGRLQESKKKVGP